MNKKTLWITLVVLILGVASMVILMAEKAPSATTDTNDAERVVKLFRVNGENNRRDISYPGRIQPEKHAELFFRVSGPVIEQKLKLGQTVEPGTVLMRIDPRDYEREVERLTHELEMQKVQTNLATIEFERQKKLLASNAASRAAYDVAQAKKKASDVQIAILGTSLKIAQDRLKDTILYAPFHGTLTAINIEEHEIAQANVPVIGLQNLRNMKIKINIPGGNLPDVSIYDVKRFEGNGFRVTFPGRGSREFIANIAEFKPNASAESETYELLLIMKQPDDFAVLPGMAAEVHNLPHLQKIKSGAVAVPFAAVFQRNGKSCVWIYRPDGMLTLREIILGEPADERSVFVEKNLAPGELVVAAGGDWLNEKNKVRVLNPEVLK